MCATFDHKVIDAQQGMLIALSSYHFKANR